MKKLISTLLIATVSVGLLAGCGSNGSSSTGKNSDGLVVLRDAVMTGQLDQYTTAVGLWQGIFEKHGIDLQTTEFVAGINTIDSVVNGTADIGMMADYAAVNRLGNTKDETDLKIFSELSGSQAMNGGLYVAPEFADDLSKLDGSKGFMTMTGTVSDYYTYKAIEYLKLDPDKQNLINTDSSQTQLALASSGDASAIVAFGSNGKYFEDYGWKLVVPADQLEISTGAYFLAREGFITENKEVLSDFLKAIKESADYIDEHLDESAEYLAGKTGVKAEDFKLMWQAYELKTGFSEEAAQHLENIESWAYNAGRFPEEYNIRDFIDTEVVDIAFPDAVTIVK